MNVEEGFQVGDLWAMARRRVRWSAWIALVIFLATFWIAMALPNEYESYATILVEPQSVSPDLITTNISKTDLTKRLGLMTAQILARPRLSRIIDDLGLYEEESRTLVREEIIDLMRDAVRVEPVIPELADQGRNRRDEEINTFRILFTYRDAETAAAVAQELANNFIDRHIKARVEQSGKSLEFMEAELDRLASDIREVETRIAEVKGANRGSLPEETNANHSRLDRLTGQLAYAQRALADARSDEAFYRSRVAAAESSGGAPDTKDQTSPERRLRMLELGLSEMQARGFTEKHPDVQKARLEMEALRAQIRARKERGDIEDEPRSFVEQSVDAELRRAEQNRIAAEEEVGRLVSQVKSIEELLGRTPRVAEELGVLEREYRHLFESYQDFSNRKLEATVSAQLERRQLGEPFRVLEHAFPAPAPSSPDRLMIVALGAFFAAVLAVAMGVLLEVGDASMHSARQLQSALNIPVLAAIPTISLASDRATARRRWLGQVLAMGGLIAFVMVGSAANYLWVNGRFGPSIDEARESAAPEAMREAEPPPSLPTVPKEN